MFDGEPPVPARIRIGELARSTGMTTQAIRAWERRYGLLNPERTPGGLRLYDDSDVRRVRAMRALIDAGIAPAEAAQRIVAEATAGPRVPRRAPAVLEPDVAQVERLGAAIDRLDTTLLHRELDHLFGRLSVATALQQVVLPTLARLGVEADDHLGIAREHLFTNLLRGRLEGLARTWDEGDGARVLLACAARELHDLSLLMFGLVLRETGYRVVYLGANTPSEAIVAAQRALDPAPGAVVVASSSPRRMHAAMPGLEPIKDEVRILLAGAGATAEAAQHLGATILEPNPVIAAQSGW